MSLSLRVARLSLLGLAVAVATERNEPCDDGVCQPGDDEHAALLQSRMSERMEAELSRENLSGAVFCNPTLGQMCPPGNVACPECGSTSCQCPGGPGPSPSPSPSGPMCGNSMQSCTSSQVCIGYYHSWGCVGSCANNMACQGAEGSWDGCSSCKDRAEYVMNWNNPGYAGGFSQALSKVAGEFPSECGCLDD
ncbi:unnamed protein product [Prorocentrum cordatum]|uniref:Uncharacterized protein n=1 Tax=Prorocentrum cordatum TaxID=2364126 RepID=A0ABN9TF22_9DINO|nr:unnamed protein product [Polarella glacialis]|mmetsp:Transcript_66993/g.174372  ORF Transcript_66993/g.174372 Transcript_66993/m.174372 type:complete len:193 (+) Transcript_66993:93-671(+)